MHSKEKEGGPTRREMLGVTIRASAAAAHLLLARRSMAAPLVWFEEHDNTKDGKGKLKLQFADDFTSLDLKQWMPLTYESRKGNRATVLAEDGCAVLRASTSENPATAAGLNSLVGLTTRKKWFNPGLRGTAGVEVSMLSYEHGGEYIGKVHPHFGRYPMGWTLTIGNYQGPVAGDPADSRSVQVIFDGWEGYGLNNSLCRSIIPGDREKYPEYRDWHPSRPPHGFTKEGYEIIDGKDVRFDNMPMPSIDPACVLMSCKVWPAGEASQSVLTGRRVGLFITHDGNRVHWTLDGVVIQSAVMAGLISSDSQGFKDGAYVTVFANGGYRRNAWKIDDVKIYMSA